MKLLEQVLDIIAPHNCLLCEREGALLCIECLPIAVEPAPSSCFKCSKQTDNFRVCNTCRTNMPMQHLWFVTFYEKIAKKLVATLKFEQKRSAAFAIANYLDAYLPQYNNIVVVPIPTAPKHVRERGFDHSKMIAKQFARQRNLKYQAVLVKTRNVQQVGQSKHARLAQAKDLFGIVRPNEIKNQNLLLLDDVVTTGATLREAARVLKEAGARSVSAATFALSRLK